MGKISKKNQDPKQPEQDAAALAKFLSKRSEHFAIGTGVIYRDERYTVNQYVHDKVVLIHEDGHAIMLTRPYFMR